MAPGGAGALREGGNCATVPESRALRTRFCATGAVALVMGPGRKIRGRTRFCVAALHHRAACGEAFAQPRGVEDGSGAARTRFCVTTCCVTAGKRRSVADAKRLNDEAYPFLRSFWPSEMAAGAQRALGVPISAE